jgi:phenylacetate-CoA ligase
MNFTLQLQDWTRKTNIIATKKFLEQSDFWDKEQIEVYQLRKLQKLVTFSYEHVPYYHRLFDEIGLKPNDIKTLDDIRKVPVLTKKNIRKEHQYLVADNVNINSHKIKIAKTGGTTGMPLEFYKNTQTRDFTWGAYYRWYNWMGIKPGDKKVHLWGAATVLSESKFQSLKRKLIDTLDRSITINCYNINDNTLPSIVKKLIQYKPVILQGYLSAIFQIAKYFKDHNLTLPSLKAISSTTETLLPIYREYIEDAFGVKMYDQYGCGECNSMAFECVAHSGLHVNEEHCFLEVLDKVGNPCNHEPGRVVLTDLDNYAFPFIRYENGDNVVVRSEKCECGRHSRVLHSIVGRTMSVIYLKDGSSVGGYFFDHVFQELGYTNFKYFKRFQIYQKKKGDFICRLEKTDKELPQEDLKKIKSTLRQFGNNVQVELLDQLPKDKSGKYSYVLSDIKD